MWSFLNPYFLWAASAAVIPLLLHLLQRRRTVRIPFSTIRFLKLAQKRSANRIRLENLLLWLLRTLLMVLIALAFAMPVLRTRAWGNLFGRAQRDVAIVWDVSYSMGYESGRKKVWDESRDAVASIIQSLNQGDRVCIYLAADNVIPLIEQPSADLTLALSLVKTQEVHPTTSELAPAVQAACEALKNSGQREREVYLVTDGQAVPWTAFREAAAAAEAKAGAAGEKESASAEPAPAKPASLWNPKLIDRKIMFFTALLGTDAPQNTAPLQVDVEPALLMPGTPAKITARLGHTGPAQNTAVSLVVDDQEVNRRTAFLGEDRGEDVTFNLAGLAPGLHPAHVDTPADGLALDNAFYFLLRVKDELPILCAGSEADCFFLMRALNPRGDAGSIKVQRVDPEALAGENLDPYLCVFLANALPISGQAVQNLERYVRRGGVLTLFPGDRATTADYQSWSCLPAVPKDVDEAMGEAPRMAVRLVKPTDPIFRSLKLPPGTIPMIHIRRQLAWSAPEEGAETLLSVASEKPFLMARNFGKGRVLMFGVSADRRWSDLPLTPFFLPFVQQIIQFSAGAGKEPLYVWTTHNLTLSDLVGDVPETAEWVTPRQETQPIRRLKTQNEMTLQVENVMEPGIYRLTRPGGRNAEPAVAVNVSRRESDLRPVPAAEVPKLLGVPNSSVSRDKDDLMRQVEEHRVGRPLGESLLWLAMVLAVIELWVANRMSRPTAGLSERLKIDLAGRIRAKTGRGAAGPAAGGAGGGGGGMTAMLALVLFEHTTPNWAIGTAAAIALVVLGFTAWRYLPFGFHVLVLGLLRVLFFALLVWCLLLPTEKNLHTEMLRPRFLVLVDSSKSMALSPKPGVPTRWAEVQRVLKESWEKTIAKDADVEVYTFAEALGPKTSLADVERAAPDGATTMLRDSLRRLVERYRGQRLGGVLLLTDGIDTRESTDHWAGENWPCPIYTVRLEPSAAWEIAPEVRVERVDTARRVVAGWDSKLTAIVSGEGTKGNPVNVQLLENGKMIQEAPTQLPADGGSREVTFQLEHPMIGNYLYTVNVPALEGEIQTNDNSYAVSVQVIDTKNRVLYLEGVPRWESKYLTRALRAIKDISLLAFLRGPGNQMISVGFRGTMTLDLTPEQLAQYKIIILGDLDAEALTEPRARALVKFVDDGGSLVLLGGPSAWGPNGSGATELAKLMPVRRSTAQPALEGKFSASLTAEGRTHPAFMAADSVWQHAPPVLSIFPDASVTPGATALVVAQTPAGPQPLIATERYGQGKVAAILTDSLWRWQLNPGQEQPYQRFWLQMIQWLKPAEEQKETYSLDLFADADQQFLGQPVNLGAVLGGPDAQVLKDVSVTCEIQTPDNRRIPFSMTRQNVTTTTGKTYPGYGLPFTADTPGLHRAVALATVQGRKVESAPYTFFIKPFTPESNPRPANVELLKLLAEASGGKFCEMGDTAKVLSALKFEAGEEQRISYTTLWNKIPVIACLLGLLSVEWAVRKFRNMA